MDIFRSLGQTEITKEDHLTPTGSMVLETIKSLGGEPGYYIIYLDNYFTSIPLFEDL